MNRFVAAFNERDLEALRACLASDATAVVVGAPFPEEVGAEAICKTSLAYLLEQESALRARRVDHERTPIVLLDSKGRLDVAIEWSGGELAQSLRYLTMPNSPDDLRAVAVDLGLPVSEGSA